MGWEVDLPRILEVVGGGKNIKNKIEGARERVKRENVNKFHEAKCNIKIYVLVMQF